MSRSNFLSLGENGGLGAARKLAYVALRRPNATASNSIAVLDVDPASSGYGTQIARVGMTIAGGGGQYMHYMPGAGRKPHSLPMGFAPWVIWWRQRSSPCWSSRRSAWESCARDGSTST